MNNKNKTGIGTVKKDINKNSDINAIILAAGMGNRLVPLTNSRPKCLLKVGGKSILERQLSTFGEFGINNISIVRGYRKKMINLLGINYYDNTDYKNNNILHSLFFAEKAMNGPFVFSYSDIVYGKDIVESLLKARGDIVITVDTDWKKHYKGRIKHPLSEAELTKSEDGKVVKIGKDVVKIDEAQGEFIGLAKFTDKGTEIIKEVYRDLLSKYKKKDSFQNAREFQKAYLTDFIQELVDRDIEVRTADIDKVWTEIDTDEDLERANKIWK